MRKSVLIRLLFLALLLGFTVGLVGCGQKGDLYHPEKYQEYRR
ncbi:MAG: lipoprotein [Pseudomonadota bacterium]|nr:lipoprotein [Pseudomonadota bacterium]